MEQQGKKAYTDNSEFVLVHDREKMLDQAIVAVEWCIVRHCQFTNQVLERAKNKEDGEAAYLVDASFRGINHLSITLERLQNVLKSINSAPSSPNSPSDGLDHGVNNPTH